MWNKTKSINGSTRHADREHWDIANEPCIQCKHKDYCKNGFVCRDFIIYTDTNKAGEVSRVPSRLLYFKHYRLMEAQK